MQEKRDKTIHEKKINERGELGNEEFRNPIENKGLALPL
ncbi:hypothetical protein TREPR_0997 [Treponema primitia ZAS-2]|uniref:Uncharacterized protein n=1 Tax=Treponema primitia (strain ATCC BAA-887 / DSM 12427 / ZAS-2) TaxID=545694 RepID=F5YHS5_TREPZ|nr:hypothetical protein TREPR_0997 [Treponema primitia ZAS-2]